MSRDLSKSLARKYDILQKLGEGYFGVVHLAEDKRNGFWYALKIAPKKFSGDEINLLQSLEHPNIVQLFEFCETATHYNLVLEYLEGGNLKQRIQQYGGLAESTARLFFLQMCKAVEYMHRRRIVHFDLKPDNMLLACQGDVTLLKICDFGVSQEQQEYYLKSGCGTKLFRAPEYWTARHINYKVDIWSLGITLYYCLSGKLPFTSPNEICTTNCRFDQYFWNSISNQPIKLIQRFLTRNYHNRPNIYFAINSFWLKNRALMITYDSLINQG